MAGCLPAQYDIDTAMSQGRVVFDTKESVGLIPTDPCPEYVTIEEAGRMVWEIRRQTAADCSVQPGFPFTYGTAPRGYAQSGKPEPLKPGAVYVIHGRDYRKSAGYMGGFRIAEDGRSVVSFRGFDAEVQNAL